MKPTELHTELDRARERMAEAAEGFTDEEIIEGLRYYNRQYPGRMSDSFDAHTALYREWESRREAREAKGEVTA